MRAAGGETEDRNTTVVLTTGRERGTNCLGEVGDGCCCAAS